MKYLSDYTERSQTKLFERTGSFFAFGNKQFKEAAKDGVKYVSMGHGLICPENNVQALIEGLNNIQDAAIRQDVEENNVHAIIEREYFNYESQVSMDTSNAMAALEGHKRVYPELFTDDLISKVFHKCFLKAVENDWF